VIGFFALSPYLQGDGEIARNFAKKGALVWIIALHFGKNMLFLPIFEIPWWTRWVTE